MYTVPYSTQDTCRTLHDWSDAVMHCAVLYSLYCFFEWENLQASCSLMGWAFQLHGWPCKALRAFVFEWSGLVVGGHT